MMLTSALVPLICRMGPPVWRSIFGCAHSTIGDAGMLTLLENRRMNEHLCR